MEGWEFRLVLTYFILFLMKHSCFFGDFFLDFYIFIRRTKQLPRAAMVIISIDQSCESGGFGFGFGYSLVASEWILFESRILVV